MPYSRASFRLLVILAIWMMFSSVLLPTSVPNTSMVSEQPPSFTVPSPKDGADSTLADIDFDRFIMESDSFPNPGFEIWWNPHEPRIGSGEGSGTSRSTERYSWIASTPWPVNEGINSLGMQARAIDIDHESEARLIRSPFFHVSNPKNLTLSFDFWVDEMPDPIDSDSLIVKVKFSTFRFLNYYVSGNDSTVSNITTNSKYFDLPDAPVKTWGTFDRNITEDYFATFGSYPTYDCTYIEFILTSRNASLSRVFLDDINFANGTSLISNGGFESYLAGWALYGNSDPGDLSRSTTRQEGDWSLNATVLSNGNISTSSFETEPQIRLTDLNPDRLTFWWRGEDLENVTEDTYAYLKADSYNETDYFPIYYFFSYGGTDPAGLNPGDQLIQVDGFNTTGTWNFFNRSIWQDVTAQNQTDYLVVDTLSFYMYAKNDHSRLSILLDDLSLTSLALNDGGYEDQPAIGDEVIAWDLDGGFNTDSHLTVTGQALTGSKAANLTVVGQDSFWGYQYFEYKPLNQDTETFLDVSWYVEEFSGQDDEYVSFIVYFSDGNSLEYLFVNGSAIYPAYEDAAFIILPDTNTIGSWSNMQRSLFHDYKTAYGSAPNTTIVDIEMVAEGQNAGSRIRVLFDDVYLYDDIAPDVHSISQTPTAPEVNDAVDITVDVADPGLDTVLLHYRVDGGTWSNLTMAYDAGDMFNGTIPGQEFDSLVEYFISANDTIGKITTLLNGAAYFSYTVVDTIDPLVSITAPSNESTISGIRDITVDAGDSGSGVARVEILVDSTLMFNETDGPYSYSWDTTTVANGIYTIQATVYDNAGNSATTTHTVTVSNAPATTPTTTTTPTTSPTTTPPPLDLTVLILIVAGVAGAVVIVIVVFMRSRKEA